NCLKYMTKKAYTRSGRTALGHVPVAVGRPALAARAARLFPLAATGRTDPARVEGVPRVEAAAYPAITPLRLPAAARTADPRAFLPGLVFVLRPDRDLRGPPLSFEELEPGPRLSFEELEGHGPG